MSDIITCCFSICYVYHGSIPFYHDRRTKFEIMSEKKKTYQFYVIGNPVGHSLSPLMHNYFLKHFKISASYSSLELEAGELGNTLKKLRDSGASGVNVTLPFKEAVMEYMDVLSDEARTMGSVNTIKFSGGILEGHNTDSFGFEKSLDMSLADKKVTILGAGGAARAVMLSCGRSGCKSVTVINRTPERAEKIVNAFITKFPETRFDFMASGDAAVKENIRRTHLLVNATSVGLKSRDLALSPVRTNYLHEDLVVIDLIYNPLETLLLRRAREKGIRYINGIDMLIYQGLASLQIWLDQDLPYHRSLIDEVREKLGAALTAVS